MSGKETLINESEGRQEEEKLVELDEKVISVPSCIAVLMIGQFTSVIWQP